MYRKEEIKKLTQFAKEHNCRIRFVNKARDCGDFTIFIYKGNERTYSVGFDGVESKQFPELSFDNCVKNAYIWIKEQDEPIKEEARWDMHFAIKDILIDYFTEDTSVDLSECAGEIIRKISQIIKENENNK